MVTTIRKILLLVVAASVSQAQDAQPREDQPKIVLVLSGGAALGFAHVGFLKLLEEVGIPIDAVAGNSMGSLIGGLYAAGYSPGDIEAVAKQINWAQVFLNEGADRTDGLMEERRPFFTLAFDRSGTGVRKGLLPDQNITLLLSRLMYRVSMLERFEDLPLPFRTIAVDIANGITVPLERGVLYRAMRASMSLPLIFPPVPLNGTYFVDGGILDNNPVDLALEWGADIIIDIDVGSFASRKPSEINSLSVVADQTIRLIQSNGTATGANEYRLAMDLSDFFWTDFAKSQALIDRGEAIARLPENRAALEALAAEIEKLRPLEKRDWRRSGSYQNIPEPLFTRVRLDSINSDGVVEPEESYREEFPPKYLTALFGAFFNKSVDLSRLEAAIEIVRRRGLYESVGYHVEQAPEDATYTLVLTGVRAQTRKNEFSLTADAVILGGRNSRIGMSESAGFTFRDPLLPNSLLKSEFSFSDSQGAHLSLGYTQHFSPLFALRLKADGAYSAILASQPDRELSTFAFVAAEAQAAFTLANFFELALSYRYAPLWYEDTERGAYRGDLHTAALSIDFDTQNITQPLFFTFLYNSKWRLSLEFPFAGSRFHEGFPWYERFELTWRKLWVIHPWRNLVFDAGAASYRGELESKWTLFSPVGGIPGYSGEDIQGRHKLIFGATYLEEIRPLSNLLSMRSFFRLTIRGGSLWRQFDSFDQFRQWRGGVRVGLHLETPIGTLFAGPEFSFDGRVQFSIYYN
jgi:predicted acylesterase/phospholipase RssA